MSLELDEPISFVCRPPPADLFTWATDCPITKEQAMKCARRQQGRRWEAVYEELMALGGGGGGQAWGAGGWGGMGWGSA